MKKEPLVSVIIPCHNTAHYLPKTLESLFSQSMPHFEAIAIDDGSTDNTLEILSQYAQQDPRLHVLSQDNTYCVIARTNAIKHARGKYLVCLDSDDILAPDYLKKCTEIAERNNNISIVYSKAMLFDKINKVWKLPKFGLPSFLLENCIYITALIRKSAYDSVGGFDTQLTLLEDWDLFISLIKNGQGIHYINEPLFFYRIRKDQSSVSNIASDQKLSDNLFKIYQKHYEFYKAQGIFFQDLIDGLRITRKNNIKKYNQPLRKYFYKFLKPTKYQKIKKFIDSK